MYKKLTCLALLAALAGCASSELSPAGQKVRVITNDPPRECQEVGQQTAMSGMGVIAAKNMLRNWAAGIGATDLRLEAGLETRTDTQITATAFKCHN